MVYDLAWIYQSWYQYDLAQMWLTRAQLVAGTTRPGSEYEMTEILCRLRLVEYYFRVSVHVKGMREGVGTFSGTGTSDNSHVHVMYHFYMLGKSRCQEWNVIKLRNVLESMFWWRKKLFVHPILWMLILLTSITVNENLKWCTSGYYRPRIFHHNN